MWDLAFVTNIFQLGCSPKPANGYSCIRTKFLFSSLKDFVTSKKNPILDKHEHRSLTDYFIQCLQKCFQYGITSSPIFSYHGNNMSFHCSDMECLSLQCWWDTNGWALRGLWRLDDPHTSRWGSPRENSLFFLPEGDRRTLFFRKAWLPG